MLKILSPAELSLHDASARGDIEAVRQLLSDASVKLWRLDSNHRLALHRSCIMPFFTENQDTLKSNKMIIADELMMRDPTTLQAQDNEGNTPLHLMASNGFESVIMKAVECNPVALAIANNQGLYPLHMAISANQNTIAQFLLQQTRDEHVLATLVHSIVKANNLPILTYFCKQHPLIDLNLSVRGITPLDIAQSMHLEQMSQFLIEHGVHSTLPTYSKT